MQFRDLVDRLGPLVQAHSLTVKTDRDPTLVGVAALAEAPPQSLSYVEGVKFASLIATTKARALIIPCDETIQSLCEGQEIAWIAVKDPRLAFAQAISLFYQPFRPPAGIHATAIIDPSVTLGQDLYLGPHVVLHAGVTLGDRVCIHANAVVYPGVTIGDGTILHANCTIHERTQIGPDCVIHSGAVIGAEGFGFVPTAEGWFKMEQSGVVILERGVEVGCNSAIDRPAVGETRIGQYTKLDNLVHIAHGCHIGQACAMAAQVGVAGGVTIGNRVILAGQVGVANQSKIGDGAIASAQTGIHGEVAPGEVVSGSPHVPNRLYLKASAIYKRLPELYQTVKQLAQKS